MTAGLKVGDLVRFVNGSMAIGNGDKLIGLSIVTLVLGRVKISTSFGLVSVQFMRVSM